MTTHFSIFARRIPWTEESGGQRVGHDWVTNTFTFFPTCHKRKFLAATKTQHSQKSTNKLFKKEVLTSAPSTLCWLSFLVGFRQSHLFPPTPSLCQWGRGVCELSASRKPLTWHYPHSPWGSSEFNWVSVFSSVKWVIITLTLCYCCEDSSNYFKGKDFCYHFHHHHLWV